MSLGKRLKVARLNKGLTQEEAAKHLGITFQALSNYERDVRDPDTKLLKSMAELYGAPLVSSTFSGETFSIATHPDRIIARQIIITKISLFIPIPSIQIRRAGQNKSHTGHIL